MSDLISRQAAIDALDRFSLGETDAVKLAFRMGDYLKRLPSAQERKTGRWKKISPAGIYECSECGRNVMTADIEAYEFCHGCGAKMEEGDPD